MPLVLAPFYLLRHGETDANVRQVAAGGGLDSPLTANGIAQAEALAQRVEHLLDPKPSHIYHSSMSRARETARLVNSALGLDMSEHDSLKEHVFGDWENMEWAYIKTQIERRAEPPNGETYNQFNERVRDAVNAILAIPHSAPPLIVAHGGTFHAIARLYGRDSVQISNCELHFFEPDPQGDQFPWNTRVLHKNPPIWT